MQMVRCSCACSASRAKAEALRNQRAAVGSSGTGESPSARQSMAKKEGEHISMEEVSVLREASSGGPECAGEESASPSDRESLVATGHMSTKYSMASCSAVSLLRARGTPALPRPGVACRADRPAAMSAHAKPSMRSEPSGSSAAAVSASGSREEMGVALTTAAAASASDSAAVSSWPKKSIAKARSACCTSAAHSNVQPPEPSSSDDGRLASPKEADSAPRPVGARGGAREALPSVCRRFGSAGGLGAAESMEPRR
mmetsp:Transcript_5198/g.17246  ORF Transcript_5198/g.17246 Transcript_5198/m.17246 type:complete len:257 (-) Transcript_5198:5585-6355(-)